MPDMVKRAHTVADDLIGTAGNLHDHATPDEINNAKFCSLLDELAFQCNCCGWWCSVDEMKGDEICEECDESIEHE